MPATTRASQEKTQAPLALGLLCVGLLGAYGIELSIALRHGPAELGSFLHGYGLVPREVLAGRWFQLGTAIFLHADPIHLLSNVAFLLAFGLEVEPRVGARRFAALFLGCGLAAGLLHVASSPASFVPTVGASGAVSGVLGAWWRQRGAVASENRGDGGGRALGRVPALALFSLWVGAQVAVALVGVAGQAGWAHLGGFAAGLLVGARLARVRERTA